MSQRQPMTRELILLGNASTAAVRFRRPDTGNRKSLRLNGMGIIGRRRVRVLQRGLFALSPGTGCSVKPERRSVSCNLGDLAGASRAT